MNNAFERQGSDTLGIECVYVSTWEKKKRFPVKLPKQHGGPGFTQLVTWIQDRLCYRANQAFRCDWQLLEW